MQLLLRHAGLLPTPLQFMSHPPQLKASVVVSTQPLAQSIWLAVHTAVQIPLVQV